MFSPPDLAVPVYSRLTTLWCYSGLGLLLLSVYCLWPASLGYDAMLLGVASWVVVFELWKQHQRKHTVKHMRASRHEGCWQLQHKSGKIFDATVLSSTRVTASVIFLRFQAKNKICFGRYSIVLWRKETPADSWRRLCVYLRLSEPK